MNVCYSTWSLRLFDELGKGSSGVVWRCQFENSIYAAKIVELTSQGNPVTFECMIMSSFDSPYLNFAEKILTDRDRVVILSKLAASDLLSLAKETFIQIELVERYIKELLIALHSLHSHSIIHGDVKARNILVYRDKSIRLTDFTLSKYGWTKSLQGYTVTHRAPEVWKGQIWGYSADIWALGCTIYEMIVGKSYFPPLSSAKYFDRVIQQSTFKLPTLFSLPRYEKVKKILLECFTVESLERPTASALLLKYFSKVPQHSVRVGKKYVLCQEILYEIERRTHSLEMKQATSSVLSKLEPQYHIELLPAVLNLVRKILFQENNLGHFSRDQETKLCHLLQFNFYVSL